MGVRLFRSRILILENTYDLKNGYYFNSKYQVTRSLYINNILYTISSRMIKAKFLSL